MTDSIDTVPISVWTNGGGADTTIGVDSMTEVCTCEELIGNDVGIWITDDGTTDITEVDTDVGITIPGKK